MFSNDTKLWSIASSTLVALVFLSFALTDIGFKLSSLHGLKTTLGQPTKHWRDWSNGQPETILATGSNLKSIQEDPSDFVRWLQQSGITIGRHPIITIGDSNYLGALKNLRARLDQYGYGDDLVVLCLDDACAQETSYHGWRVALDPTRAVLQQVAEVKFTSGIDLLQNGYNFVFLDGDISLTIYRDPFKDMLPISDVLWDIQFQMDNAGHGLNIGWFLARACNATEELFRRSYAQWLDTSAWDQAIMNDVAHEMEGNQTLRIHRLDLARFRNFMLEDWERDIFGSEETVQTFIQESAIIHYTCVERDLKSYFGANLGGFSDLDGYYSNPASLLGVANIAGTSEAIFQQVAFALQISNSTGRTFIWPNSVSIVQMRPVDANAIQYIYHNQLPGVRVVSHASARTAGLKVVEGRYLQNQQHIVKGSVRSTRKIEVGMFLQQDDQSSAARLEGVIRDTPSHITPILDFSSVQPQGRSWLRPQDFNIQISYDLNAEGYADHLHDTSILFEGMLQKSGMSKYSESMMLELRRCKNVEWDMGCLKVCEWDK